MIVRLGATLPRQIYQIKQLELPAQDLPEDNTHLLNNILAFQQESIPKINDAVSSIKEFVKTNAQTTIARITREIQRQLSAIPDIDKILQKQLDIYANNQIISGYNKYHEPNYVRYLIGQNEYDASATQDNPFRFICSELQMIFPEEKIPGQEVFLHFFELDALKTLTELCPNEFWFYCFAKRALFAQKSLADEKPQSQNLFPISKTAVDLVIQEFQFLGTRLDQRLNPDLSTWSKELIVLGLEEGCLLLRHPDRHRLNLYHNCEAAISKLQFVINPLFKSMFSEPIKVN
jgi:hypothetical protein